MNRENNKTLKLAMLFFLGATCISCSTSTSQARGPAMSEPNSRPQFLASGSILLSHKIPTQFATLGDTATANILEPSKEQAPRLMAPLIGYFPPAAAYLPAENETWLEVIKDEKKIVLRKGKESVKEIAGEGEINIKPGEYYLQHKQKQPLWYAPDDYFAKRKLQTPDTQNRLRYRKGALGQYVLYPTTAFAIHCAPIWSEDVGGLRVSLSELSSIYYMLPVGAPIVVR